MNRTPEPDRRQTGHHEEPPPFGGAWWRLYAGVLAWLGLLILAFYLFSRRFAP